jgi:hypothetical protein
MKMIVVKICEDQNDFNIPNPNTAEKCPKFSKILKKHLQIKFH